eukprot:457634_1
MYIIITVFSVIITIMILILFISSLISMIKGLIQNKIIVSRVLIASMLALSLFLICTLSVVAYSITKLYDNPLISIRLMATGSYVLAQESMVFSFISRIHTVFKGSTLEISKCTAKLLYYIWFITLIFGTLGAIVSTFMIHTANGQIILSLIGAIWILSFFPLSITLIVLFIQKIKNLIIISSVSRARDISITSRNRNKNEENTPLDIVDVEFLHVAIKNGILVPIAITVTLMIVLIGLVIRILQFDIPQILIIDGFVATLSMYLLFNFNQNIYNKICFYPHKKCQQWILPSLCNQSMMERERQKIPSYNMEKIDNDGGNSGGKQTFPATLTRNTSSPVLPAYVGNAGGNPLTIESQVYAVSNPLTKQSKNDIVSDLKFGLINNNHQSNPMPTDVKNIVPTLKIAQSNLL